MTQMPSSIKIKPAVKKGRKILFIAKRRQITNVLLLKFQEKICSLWETFSKLS